MDAYGQPAAPVRVLTHIKELDDGFGQFLVRVICDSGACREIEPEASARLVGWSMNSAGARAAPALLEQIARNGMPLAQPRSTLYAEGIA